MSITFTIFCDGAALDNPGEAGVGLVVYQNGQLLERISASIGIATQEQAQFEAIIRAVTYGLDQNAEELEIYCGSQTIWEQAASRLESRAQGIMTLQRRLFQLEKLIRVHYEWTNPMSFGELRAECLKMAVQACALEDETPGQLNEKRRAIQQSAGGVVYKKEGGQLKVCLIAKKQGKIWALPKGRVEAGESWEQAAIREVMEETGHLATISHHINQIDYLFYWKENRVLYYKIVSFFLMPLISENAGMRDGEADLVSWFNIGEAWRRLYYRSEKDILRQAQKILKAAHL